MLKQSILSISLLISLCGGNIIAMQPSSRYSRRMKCIRDEYKKHKRRQEVRSNVDTQTNDDAGVCCTPQTANSILTLLSGLATLIVTIVKLVAK